MSWKEREERNKYLSVKDMYQEIIEVGSDHMALLKLPQTVQ